MIKSDILNRVNVIEGDDIDCSRNLILGQQLYSTVLYSYLCSHIVADYKLYRARLRAFPRENLLRYYLQELSPVLSRQAENIRKSYIALSVQYRLQGYDALSAVFKKVAAKHSADFLCDSSNERDFMTASVDSAKVNNFVLKFSDKYGLNYFLTCTALLTRSQMGENYLEHVGLVPLLSAKEISVLKKGLIDWGQELLLLTALDFCLRNHLMNSIDLSAFDAMNVNLNRGDIRSQLEKILRLDKFCLSLFEASEIPIKIKLTDKDKRQIEYGLLAVFFLSNFAPERKFALYFNDTFKSFYVAENICAEPNYRFEVLAYFSAFNLKTETKYRRSNGKIFRATATVKNSKDELTFVCENESKEFANKEIWHIVHEKILAPVKQFFESGDDVADGTAISFFIRNVCNMHTKPSTFFAKFGILFADNFSRIDPNICLEIMRKTRSFANAQMMETFIDIVCNVNKDKYICVNEKLYSYAEWIRYSCDRRKSSNATEGFRIEKIYNNIVNPTANLQKKLISTDYRLVGNINPLSEDMALYALSVDLDAYNYLPFTTPSIDAYRDKLKAEEVDFSNIGILSTPPENGVVFSIMDSQKPFHLQLKQFISGLEIKSIKIACGYCFASGLILLDDVIRRELTAGVSFELYVGALQNYDESISDNLITGMDKNTVRLLNQYFSFPNFNLFTCPDRFYHGKIYLFEGEDASVVIVGSSNLSRSAFVSNYELNMAFKISVGGSLLNQFLSWTNQLKFYSKRIESLDENFFGNNEVKLEVGVLIKRVSAAFMRNKINGLTNAEVRYRLNLWMSHEPDVIAEDLGIAALPNYFVFVYEKHGLIVLESFEAGNAYFCLKSQDSFESVINSISTFSKSEIFKFSEMPKRGYHVQNKFTLECNIQRYFGGNQL